MPSAPKRNAKSKPVEIEPLDETLIEGAVPARWVPVGLRVGAAWSWRVILIVAVIALIAVGISALRVLVVPVLIALMLAALLKPVVDWLERKKWPRIAAVAVVEIGLILFIVALVWLAVSQFSGNQLKAVAAEGQAMWEGFRNWLASGPLHITTDQLNTYMAQASEMFKREASTFVNGAIKLGSTAGHVGAGLILTLFSTLFFLYDAKGIYRWIVNLLPKRVRAVADGGFHKGWTTLESYVRVQILVAFIDAVGIGIGAFFIGVPFVIPMSILVFLGSFIPFVGAIATGALVSLLALFTKGWVAAIIMLAVVLLVQQIEGHVLQPFVMGTAVKVHPLAIVLAVAGGSLVAGIAGALFAVPLVAVAHKMIAYFGQAADDQAAARQRALTAKQTE